MKCYSIFPSFQLIADDERSAACIEMITALVVDALRQKGDDFHYAVDWLDPGAPEDSGVFQTDIAEPHVRELRDIKTLRDRIRKSVDPYYGTGSPVRSIATCRSVVFGYDGHAFICQRLEDPVPVSPDPTSVLVEEQPDFLTVTDWFDGWLPGRFRMAGVR